jgi:hypothetical protein
MNLFNIERSLQMKVQRDWNTLYVAVDLHATLIKPYYDDIFEFYPDAIEVIQWFNKRPDFRVILWTASYPNEIKEFLKEAKENDITFDYINENPRELNSRKGCFDDKFYFNILLDDKAGFVGETDWTLIKNELIRLGEWDKKVKKTSVL